MPMMLTPDKLLRAVAEDLTTMHPDNEELVVRVLKDASRAVKGVRGWALRIAIGKMAPGKYEAALRWLHKFCADHPITIEED